ncbi:serine hydrolase family protein [Agromyces sp. CFH 90414]|uniref:Serine hydrolase family protein n=1 Tax=Agromyces agglutinans TaxID=2662258 RepID=A0A6I2F7K2_9MICO|nr:alpha/beta hydrolase [Agromyces agglutinans]MRG59747.1 serine hydrolase family protein [Agromyces agglutinans]
MIGVVVPGIDGSGPEHWQTLWEQGDSGLARFAPSSWEAPERDDWRLALAAAVSAAGPRAIVIAHSLGCLAAVDVLLDRLPAGGAFLVAPPDVDGPAYPDAAASFRGIRPAPLAVPAIVVASDDDPFSSPAATARFAGAIGASVVSVGAHGHLNAASGLGDWPEGRRLLAAFAAGLSA